MVKIKSFNASLYHIFINCESSYGSLVTWLCGSLFILILLVIESIERPL